MILPSSPALTGMHLGMHHLHLLRTSWFFFMGFQKKFFIIIIFLLYNIVLVLLYINMHLPWVYTCSYVSFSLED